MRAAKFLVPPKYQADWVLTKIKDYFKNDPYLKNTDWRPTYELLEYCLYQNLEINKCIKLFEELQPRDCLEFSRKLDANNNLQKYVVPPLALQMRSILHCWHAIVASYRKIIPKENCRHYGHRPETSNYIPFQAEKSLVKELDIAINTPLKIKFQTQYNSFKDTVKYFAKKAIRQDDESARAFLIQTDIKSFFHSLPLNKISQAIDLYASDISDCKKFLKELEDIYHLDHLPIGWLMSGIIVDRLLYEFHKRADILLPKIENNYKKYGLKYIAAANYVDDFFFIFEISVDKKALVSDDFRDAFEKPVSNEIIATMNNAIKDVFLSDKVEFYGHGTEKFKILYFNHRNFELLDTNFHALMNPDGYQDDTALNMFADLDERMLPADNELILNDRAYFSAQLNSYIKRIVDGNPLDIKEVKDFIKKIINKISGPEKRYIIRVIEVLETLAFIDREQYFSYAIEKIDEINSVLINSEASFDVWLKFFNRLFVFYIRSGFQARLPFVKYFTDFRRNWLNQPNISKHDEILLDSFHQNILMKRQIEKKKSIEIKFSKKQATTSFTAYEVGSSAVEMKIKNNEIFNASIASALLKTIFLRMESTAEKQKIFLNTISKIKDKNIRFQTVATTIPFIGIDNIEDFAKIINKVKSKINSKEYRKLLKTLALVKKVKKIRSYQMKLEFLFGEDISDRYLLPVTDSYNRSRSNTKMIADRLMLLCCHEDVDIITASLNISRPGLRSRFMDRAVIPNTFKGVGLGFYECLKKISNCIVHTGSGTLGSEINPVIQSIIKREISTYRVQTPLETYKMENVCEINIDDWYNIDHKKILKKHWGITLSPLGVGMADYDTRGGLKFNQDAAERVNLKVKTSFNEAKKRKSLMLVFPELSMPRKYLSSYINRASESGLIVVGGLEYKADSSKNAFNSTLICIPVEKNQDPFGRSMICFEQLKTYPAAVEKHELKTKRYKYKPGDNLFIFHSKKIGNFANLTCSDFLSVRLRLKIQEKVHFLLVPAQNPDNPTYDHLAQSCIRDLHCFSVICNSQLIGTSLIYGPYYDQPKRTVLKREGISSPEFATVRWNPLILNLSRLEDSQIPFRKKTKHKDKSKKIQLCDIKQTPPDWGY